jgi:hypothetical protein
VGQALHQAICDWVAAPDEDSRHRVGCLPHYFRCGFAVGHNYVWRWLQQLGGGGSRPIGVAPAPTKIRLEIFDRPAELFEFSPKRLGAELSLWITLRIEHQHADTPHTLGFLCVRCERPRDGRANKREELAPSHSRPPELTTGHRICLGQ